MGLITFTTFSNACNILWLMCTARTPPFNVLPVTASMYLGIIFGAPGGRKRDAAESLIMKIGNQEGFGNGFISSSMMNFRALINIAGPILFGSLYAWGSKRNWPTLAFLVGALTIMISEASLRTLTKDELGLDENGQLKASGSDTPDSKAIAKAA